ncbi:translation initiation factor IF-2 [Halodesulfurarchaeum sp. HSR-GB]|uniref:translation initiation factor IF-2 n=1 Tax=Halodesulfurarchaeum sp. HSR-GB TaxID=3074077 RepID=UPI00285FBAC0|nr:translation initiation factor IF-2 [Halodesulfurarchaeum sp. HSR-GB]MDR5656021.1 translation initiation factor IF-2 [Halodesulfurarchaeum sp. HSR-GB]
MSPDPAQTDAFRTPIVAVLGHVDHGKTSLLDKIRGSAVIEGESGAITQHIGATAVPLEVVSKIAGDLVDPEEFDLPGLLFIDTPGHHAFTTLRARGGALADIAILVVDVTDGFQPQTHEAVSILQDSETPFVVAANKVDTIPGWNPTADAPIRASYEAQSDRVRGDLDERLYEIIGDLSDAGFSADFYWRVKNFRQNVGVIPVSAETGEGVPDLLAVLMGLSQRYMGEEMEVDIAGPGAGTVLEVTDERGFGSTLDVILYDGTIEEGDEIVVGGTQGPIVTTVRALLRPRDLAEIRTEKRFEQVESVSAAMGLKIAAPDLKEALSGAPVRVVGDRETEAVVEAVREELAEVAVTTEEEGIVVKADTLGSLEAIANSLREAEIPILRAEVGDIAPRDVSVASTADEDTHQAILGFNVDVHDDAADLAAESDVRLFVDDVIYQLIEDYEAYVENIHRQQREAVFENVVRPARFRILRDHVFRQSGPAVVGVEVATGTLGRNVPVGYFENGEFERVGVLKTIQDEGEDLDELRAGERAAVSIDGPTVGRDIEEEDVLWVDLPENHAKVLEQELREDLPADEREALAQFLETRREREPFWGK